MDCCLPLKRDFPSKNGHKSGLAASEDDGRLGYGPHDEHDGRHGQRYGKDGQRQPYGTDGTDGRQRHEQRQHGMATAVHEEGNGPHGRPHGLNGQGDDVIQGGRIRVSQILGTCQVESLCFRE